MNEAPIARCDVCMTGNPEPVHILSTKPILIGNILSNGQWAICSPCRDDFESGATSSLFERWKANVQPFTPMATIIASRPILRRLWLTAWDNRTDLREGTEADRLEMIRNLEGFRRMTPDRRVP